MRNIRRIIRGDLRRITASVVGIVFIMGLCLIPCLYAWFNIFSNWDPYGKESTSRIRIAVVSLDKGSEILGVELNLGETIVGSLEANDQMGWVFADSKKEALWRVYSGDCYAALVVPENFSRDFISFLTLRFEHPELQYYENGKKNAIAPKITGQAKNAVIKQINTTVLQTLVSGASKAVLALEANGIDIETLIADLGGKLEDLSLKLNGADAALDSVVNVAVATQNLLLASSTLVNDLSITIGYTGDLADIIALDIEEKDISVHDAITRINTGLSQVNADMSLFFSELSAILTDPETYNQFIRESRDSSVTALQEMQAAAAGLQSIANSANLSALANLFGDLAASLGDLSSEIEALTEVDVSDNEQWAKIQQRLSGIIEKSTGISTLLSNIITEIVETLSVRVGSAFDSFNDAAQSAADLLRVLQAQTASAANGLSGMAGSVAQLQRSVLSAKTGINTIRTRLTELSDFLTALSESEYLQEILDLLRIGPDVLDSYVASPIRVAEEVFYPVDSYGSQMAPFYTVLSQWVAALFCAVLLKTRIREEDRPRNLRMHEHFFGRYALFFSVCVAQALITGIGDLMYVNIVCAHPVCFVLACVMTGICFSMINYMLSFTLGAAGLAVSVVVMVLQVGGAGGTYPVEVLPKIFQVLYPYMPYKFAMNAMREALSGFYGFAYLQNMLMLFAITLGCVALAFLIYIPGKWLNGLLENGKAKCGIMY